VAVDAPATVSRYTRRTYHNKDNHRDHMDVRSPDGYSPILFLDFLFSWGGPGTAVAAEAALPVVGPAAPAFSHANADSMRPIRAFTFEVALNKRETDPLQFEKTLPFAERNDTYPSIGAAFAVGTDRYVTASHVIVAICGSLLVCGLLRDTKGQRLLRARPTHQLYHAERLLRVVDTVG
jgi:hypothetical protein